MMSKPCTVCGSVQHFSPGGLTNYRGYKICPWEVTLEAVLSKDSISLPHEFRPLVGLARRAAQHLREIDIPATLYERVFRKKGAERHGSEDSLYYQSSCRIIRDVGLGFPLGQMEKKYLEADRLSGSSRNEEYIDIIGYLLLAITSKTYGGVLVDSLKKLMEEIPAVIANLMKRYFEALKSSLPSKLEEFCSESEGYSFQNPRQALYELSANEDTDQSGGPIVFWSPNAEVFAIVETCKDLLWFFENAPCDLATVMYAGSRKELRHLMDALKYHVDCCDTPLCIERLDGSATGMKSTFILPK